MRVWSGLIAVGFAGAVGCDDSPVLADPCAEQVQLLGASDRAPNGLSPVAAVLGVGDARTAPLALVGGGSTEITVEAAYGGGAARFVGVVSGDPLAGEDLDCRSHLVIDVLLRVVTADGQLNEQLHGTLRVGTVASEGVDSGGPDLLGRLEGVVEVAEIVGAVEIPGDAVALRARASRTRDSDAGELVWTLDAGEQLLATW